MAVYRDSRRESRRERLVNEHFTRYEARQFSKLEKSSPALRTMIKHRREKWERFQKWVSRQELNKAETEKAWRTSLERMYQMHKWVVQDGPHGRQRGPMAGYISVWAMYRDAEKRLGPGGKKSYKSPWEKRSVDKRKQVLDRGQVFIQKAKRGAISSQVDRWIAQLDTSITAATGKRRERLIRQRAELASLR